MIRAMLLDYCVVPEYLQNTVFIFGALARHLILLDLTNMSNEAVVRVNSSQALQKYFTDIFFRTGMFKGRGRKMKISLLFLQLI